MPYNANPYGRRSNRSNSNKIVLHKPRRHVAEVVKKYVKREMKREVEKRWKTGSFQLNLNYPITTSIFTVINGTAQGDDTFQRAGNQITITEVEINFTVTPVTGLSSRVRLLIFFDKQANGQYPGNNADISSIFAGAGSAGTATTLLSPLNPNFWPSRYTLLHDKLFSLHQEGSNVSTEKVLRFHKKGLKTKVQYNGTTNDISSITKNSLIVYAISDEMGTNQPIMIGHYIVKYLDA